MHFLERGAEPAVRVESCGFLTYAGVLDVHFLERGAEPAVRVESCGFLTYAGVLNVQPCVGCHQVSKAER